MYREIREGAAVAGSGGDVVIQFGGALWWAAIDCRRVKWMRVAVKCLGALLRRVLAMWFDDQICVFREEEMITWCW